MKELFQSCHVSASLAGDFVQYQLALGQFSSIIRLLRTVKVDQFNRIVSNLIGTPLDQEVK